MSAFYRTCSIAGVGLLRSRHLEQLQKIESDAYQLLKSLAVRHGASPGNAKAQIGQDLFALFVLNWKRSGFFVEFGATNGVDLSNTYLLEKDFGWKGILAEPAAVWRDELTRNRNAVIDFDCVWNESGHTLQFAVAEQAEFSTLSGFTDSDSHRSTRASGVLQTVQTVSLQDLLERHEAPHEIDYLSIDTEGSEYDILSAFDFSRYEISVITCEHNFSPKREQIHGLLSGNGYVRVYEGLSRWDDWFVKASLLGTD